MRTSLSAKEVESQQDSMTITAKFNGMAGANVEIHILPENGASIIEFIFSYTGLLSIVFTALISIISLSVILQTIIPIAALVLFLPLAYRVNSTIVDFMNSVNEYLPHLEQEYARIALMEDRKRWQAEPRNHEALYRRLLEKDIKVWGNIYILEYKIAEYEKQGLTHEEAIRRVAEEEGIF